ncbi:EKC/KEOPS complex subunit LAGE3-like isoform X2 [Centruroides sculpturatus]|uniref:EKC/KEOPS complex subunit LAGE3-like isoform X2 n=1 Tax=Centruroides sculpturatus TaxID=218467 RepID=UPI000C6EE44B|nr:EKC/KEOPS complex subunit LAGE3-like isoform X2 [Centruroides sculpturatus]
MVRHVVLVRELSVPFPSGHEAEIAYNSLRVDSEPLRGGVKKNFILEKNLLKVTFKAKEARQLRVSVNSFMDFLSLVIDTMDRFG